MLPYDVDTVFQSLLAGVAFFYSATRARDATLTVLMFRAPQHV